MQVILKTVSYTLIVIIAFSCNPRGNEDQAEKTVVIADTAKLDEGHSDEFDVEVFQNLVERYEDPERSDWQNPDLVLEKLSPLEGKVVADIGAGTGYFTFRLAEKGARVIAVDIDDRFLSYIEERKSELQHIIPEDRVETRLSLAEDPLLKDREVDAALLVNTYHFLDNRIAYLKEVEKGIKSGGEIVIVDYKSGEMPVGPPEESKVLSGAVIDELQQAGFENIDVDTTGLQFQYIISAQKQ